jgi:hypothetical protein
MPIRERRVARLSLAVIAVAVAALVLGASGCSSP